MGSITLQEILGVALKSLKDGSYFPVYQNAEDKIHLYVNVSMSARPARFTQTQLHTGARMDPNVQRWSVPVWLCERLNELKKGELSFLWLQSCGQSHTQHKNDQAHLPHLLVVRVGWV